MKPISYKGFQAEVTYEDGSLFIKVLHIDDLLIAECTSASEVDSAFRKLVDEYLELCRSEQREASKPFKGSLNIRLKPDVHRQVALRASSDQMSINAWIALAIEAKLGRPDWTSASLNISAFAKLLMSDRRANWETLHQDLAVRHNRSEQDLSAAKLVSQVNRYQKLDS